MRQLQGERECVRAAGLSPGGGSGGEDGRLRARAPTPVRRGRHGHYPGNAERHCGTDGGGGSGAGPVPAPQDVGPLGGRLLGGVQQRLRGGQHALVRGAQLVRLVLVNDHDVLGHLLELVHQPLTFDLGEDTALVVIPATEGWSG